MTEKQKSNLKTAYKLVKDFCKLNGFKMPEIKIADSKNPKGSCGISYGRNKIAGWVKSCANIAENPGFSWSHPHYFVDRTVYGVLLHEVGHYVHNLLGNPKIPGGKKITSYEPDMYERFAETMKLFLSNPDLLRCYNKPRYNALIKLGLKPVIKTNWRKTLGENINSKYVEACLKRIA